MPAAMKPTSPLLLRFLLFVALSGCGDGGAGDPPAVDAASDAAAPDATSDAGQDGLDAGVDAAVTRTYEKDIEPIWINRCQPCHVGEGDVEPSEPRLENGREVLVDRPSGQVTSLDLIEPGMPEASYLWLKLNNQHTGLSTTNAMPPPTLGTTFEPIPASERERIRAWIAAGAGAEWQ
jgi:hypothetical protein